MADTTTEKPRPANVAALANVLDELREALGIVDEAIGDLRHRVARLERILERIADPMDRGWHSIAEHGNVRPPIGMAGIIREELGR